MDTTLYGLLMSKIKQSFSKEKLNEAVSSYLEENPISSGATEEQVAQIEENKTNIVNKLDKNQGAENSGKFMGINTDGDIIPTTLSSPTETERGGIIAKKRTTENIEVVIGNDDKLYVPEYPDVSKKVNLPVLDDGSMDNGIDGQFLKSNGDGTTTWVNMSSGSSSIKPSNCTKLVGLYDKNLGRNKLKFKEPEDIVVNGTTICTVSYVKIIKNSSHIPTSPTDGELVDTILKENFNQHIYSFYIDTTTIPIEGDTWYYKIIPYSTEGIYNADDDNLITVEFKPYFIYGFRLDPNESDPFSNVTYIEANENFIPAYMDYNTGTFNYGNWSDVWFISDLKPCRLNYDGTVAYELDPNDYTKKSDGTDSDITDDTVDGNIMVGIPKVYYKITTNNDDTVDVRFSDIQIDEEYHCYAHIDSNGNEIPYAYEPAYNGYLYNNKLRSLSGKTIMNSKTGENEISYATANNPDGMNIWYTEVLADRNLINLLLILIGKSTDTQTTFGNGHYTGGLNATNLLQTGTMNDKGLFWGTNGTGSGVKVFGIENYWGNQWRRIGGLICDKGTTKIKLTHGTQDGSTINGYNIQANGYIVIDSSTPTGSSGGYINKMIYTPYGFIPKNASGSSSTYFCDGLWFNNGAVTYGLVGGSCGSEFPVGAFCCSLYYPVSLADWSVGAALSCKPLA